MKTYLGVDVGSLTCKFVLINEKNEVLYSSYFRTEGNPVRAIQKGLREVKNYILAHNPEIKIAGVGTTGSARYLAGVITGADLIKNEITAHAKGVCHFIPDARTVIEIGGQDSKIIVLENGIAVDFAMQTVCVKGDTKITTNPSYLQKSIKELKISEKVLTHNGEFKEVKRVFERDYQGEMIRIEISNLKKLEITPEHPILGIKREDIKCYQSYSRKNIAICKPQEERTCKKQCKKWKSFSWEPKFVPAKELRKGDFIATPLPLEITDFYSIDYSKVKTKSWIRSPWNFKPTNKFILKPSLLRLLGYYLAEGNISYYPAHWDNQIKYPAGVVFSFNIWEEKYVKDIRQIISQNFNELNVRITRKPKCHTTVVEIRSRSLAEFIKYLCGSGVEEKRLSQELLHLKPRLQKEILKGFFRGDGQLRKRDKNAKGSDKKGNRYVASTVSEILAHQLYWLLLRNQIKCTLRKSSSKTKGGKYAYFISIHGKELNKLEDKQLVNPKKQGYKSFIYKNWLFEPIKRIKKYNFKGKVYNLEVKEDNSYAANLLAVHNCAAGTGSFLDAQSFRLGIPIEQFGEISLRSKKPTTVASRCLTEDNYLLASEGVKSIKDIKEGDFVLSNGQFKRVFEKFERKYSGYLYKIIRRYSNDTPLTLTGNHQVLAIKTKLCPYKRAYSYICKENCDKSIRPRCQLRFYKNYSPQWIKVKDLKPYDLIVTPKHNTNLLNRENTVIPVWSPLFDIAQNLNRDLMRLIGYYLAEGCTYQTIERRKDKKYKKYEVQYALNQKEEKHIEDIRNLMQSLFGTTRGGIYQNFYTGEGIQLKFTSKKAHFFLKQFGQGAPNKKIPWWVFDLPKEYLIEIIKGFWRGDGSYSCIDHLTIYTSSPFLWEGLYIILEKCGYITGKKRYFEKDIGRVTSILKRRNWKIIRRHPLYKLELGGKQMIRLYKDLGIEPAGKIKTFWRDRKRTYQIAYNKENYILYPIRKIEKEFVKSVKVYNLEVEDTHSYLINGFLCKNCTIFAESDMIHKQQIGHPTEDIIAGLCQGLVRNFLNNVARGKKILPPIIFLGGVSENIGMRKAFEEALGQKIIVPKYNTVLGAFGVALLVKNSNLATTKFRGFEISDQNINCTSFRCNGCPNRCEVIEARIEGRVVARWGDRCGKWSNLKVNNV